MNKKNNLIILIIAIVLISLLISIYLPNKDKIVENLEETSSYYKLKDAEKYGIINEKGEIIVEPKYEEIIIPNINKPVFICKENNQTKVINKSGEEIFSQYSNIEPIRLENIITEVIYEKNILKFMKDGKYGIISIDGKVILEPIYDEITSLGYKRGEILVKKDNKYGIIDETGKTVIKIKYDSIESDKYYTDENFYKKSGYIVCNITSDGYRYGYYDYEGNKVLETEYNQITRLTQIENKNDIYLIVAKNGQYGVYINNNKIINTQYQSIEYNSGLEMFIVEKTGKYGVIKENGTEILDVQYSEIQINGIYIYAKNNDEQIIFNEKGNKIELDPNVIIEKTENTNYYIKIEQYEENKEYTIVDQKQNNLINNKYNYIEYLFDEKFVAINENNKSGIINGQGEIIVEFKYDLIQTIKNKNVIQCFDFELNKTEIYNKEVEKTVEMKNAQIENTNEYIKILNDDQEIYLDNNGNKIIKEEILKEIKNSDATNIIGNYKKVENNYGEYYYIKNNE